MRRLSAVLISRFLLHLQSASLRAAGSMPSFHASTTYLDDEMFSERVVGSLGAFITFEDFVDQDGGSDGTDSADGEGVELAPTTWSN